MNIKHIQDLSLSESKNPLERFLKLSEECGELAQEILIARNASGFHNKQAGPDGIKGEAVDVLLVALSIFFCHNGSIEELNALVDSKSLKWQKAQVINSSI
jgi:NTP pyrophosphatase (non-canonical NTP hydrolase)